MTSRDAASYSDLSAPGTAAGAVAGSTDTATIFGSSTLSAVALPTNVTNTAQAFAAELWFKAASGQEGTLLGEQNSALSVAGVHDESVVVCRCRRQAARHGPGQGHRVGDGRFGGQVHRRQRLPHRQRHRDPAVYVQWHRRAEVVPLPGWNPSGVR